MEAIAMYVIVIAFVIVSAAAHHSIAIVSPAAFIPIAAISNSSIFIVIPPIFPMVAVMHVDTVFVATAHALILIRPARRHRKALRQLPFLLFGKGRP